MSLLSGPAAHVSAALSTSWRHFGWRDTLFTAATLGVLGAGRLAAPLDHIFHPGHRTCRVERPVFILGHPRSGTTFLHRLVTQTGEHPAFQTWELLTPSLTLRTLVRPLVSALARWMGRGFHDSEAVFKDGAHEVRADTIEEEELLFLFNLDSQFLTLFTPVGFHEDDPCDLAFADHQPPARRRASVEWLRACLQRQIHATGKTRVVAKLPYSTLRVRSLLEAFPDARFVYLVRSPLETIPSHLSLHEGFFEQRYGTASIPPELLERYFRRRYRYNVALYRSFYELTQDGVLGPDQLMVIPYPELRRDLEGVFDRFVDFCGLSPSPALRQAVSTQATRQAAYTRTHRNRSVEAFGLTEEEVMRDLGWVYDAYPGIRPSPRAERTVSRCGPRPPEGSGGADPCPPAAR